VPAQPRRRLRDALLGPPRDPMAPETRKHMALAMQRILNEHGMQLVILPVALCEHGSSGRAVPGYE